MAKHTLHHVHRIVLLTQFLHPSICQPFISSANRSPQIDHRALFAIIDRDHPTIKPRISTVIRFRSFNTCYMYSSLYDDIVLFQQTNKACEPWQFPRRTNKRHMEDVMQYHAVSTPPPPSRIDAFDVYVSIAVKC